MDFAHAQGCAQTILNVKLNCWDRLPWLLCGIAHTNIDLARQTAAQCLKLFDQTPAAHQSLHHPLAISCLSHTFPIRADIERFANGIPFLELGHEAQLLINAFRFIPVAERVVEGKHKDIKRALSRLTIHSAPRVSMAVRQNEVLSISKDETKMKLLHEAIAEVRSRKDLFALFGMAAHPDLQTKAHRGSRRFSKEFVRVVYRNDLWSQYLDLSHALRVDTIVTEKEKQAAHKAKPTKVTWNGVLTKALALYLGSKNESRFCYSWDMRAAPHAKLTAIDAIASSRSSHNCAPVSDVTAAASTHNSTSMPLPPLQPSQQIIPVSANAAADSIAPANATMLCETKTISDEIPTQVQVKPTGHLSSTADNILSTSEAFKTKDGGSRFLFTPLRGKHFHMLHRVPHSAAATTQLLQSDDVLCLLHTSIDTNDVHAGTVAAVSVNDTDATGGSHRMNSVWVLSNFSAMQLQVGDPFLQEWSHVSGKTLLTIGDTHGGDCFRLCNLSTLLERFFQCGALLPNGDDGKPDLQKLLDNMSQDDFCDICSTEEDKQLMQLLLQKGYAAEGHLFELGFDFVLLAKGINEIKFGSFLQNPTPVLSPRLNAAVSELSLLHALLNLISSGWQWHPLSSKDQRTRAPYVHNGPKIFYSSGVDIDLNYTKALLSAEHLFGKGCHSIPHGLSSLQYLAILDGSAGPEAFAHKRKRKVKSTELEDDVELHGFGVKELKVDVAKTAAALTQHLKLLDSSEVGNLIAAKVKTDRPILKPKYFETQVAAMCGLHALNNICGTCTARQTFSTEDVADGLHTLRQEYSRDGLPFNIREHTKPSGDYSLALLQWMLQRRLVCKPLEVQFVATNLRHNCREEELMAEDLVGGLVHMPSSLDPQDGHWVAFSVHRLRNQFQHFWWLDSAKGFQAISLHQLVAILSDKNFATQWHWR